MAKAKKASITTAILREARAMRDLGLRHPLHLEIARWYERRQRREEKKGRGG